ncbi:hypothetical protein HK405_007015, partial [Cladochytrium tenue]
TGYSIQNFSTPDVTDADGQLVVLDSLLSEKDIINEGVSDMHIEGIVQQLEVTDLRPSPLVNRLFGDLVSSAERMKRDPSLSVAAERLTSVHSLCSRGESFMEEHWANRVAADPKAIHEFPYEDNYVQLTAGEYGAVCAAIGGRPARVAFVGSGPLPLTAVEWLRIDPDVHVTCFDNDAAALEQGRVTALSIMPESRDRLHFLLADALEVDYAIFDVVIVAALVGLGAEAKRGVLAAVAERVRSDALVAARSVPTDGRRWLYPRIESEQVPSSLNVIDEWMPPAGVINSLVLMR